MLLYCLLVSFSFIIPSGHFRSHDSSTRPVLSASRIEIEKFDNKDDIMIVEETSNSAHASRNKLPPSANTFENEYASEFLNNDFNLDDYEITVNTEKSRRFFIFISFSLYHFKFIFVFIYFIFHSQQDENLSKSETKAHSSSLVPKSKLTTPDTLMEVEKNISVEVLTKQNKKSAVYLQEYMCVQDVKEGFIL